MKAVTIGLMAAKSAPNATPSTIRARITPRAVLLEDFWASRTGRMTAHPVKVSHHPGSTLGAEIGVRHEASQ